MFYIPESELTIRDLACEISSMAPVLISVNGGEYRWEDDVDLTNINDPKEEQRLLEQNMREYRDILNLNMIVTNISFDIVDYHHSIVRIVAK